MVLKLYGTYPSTNTLRVALILHEKNVPFEFVKVELSKGQHKAPAYLEKQPFGQVPYIDDDGFILYESRAIGHYIATKYADQGTPGLIPTEIKAFGLFQQACSIEVWQFQEHAGKALFEVAVKPFLGLETDKGALDGHIASVKKSLDVYEKILGEQKYLGGDTITLADLFHVPSGVGIEKYGAHCLDDEKRPNVVRWWKDISTRPSWLVALRAPTSFFVDMKLKRGREYSNSAYPSLELYSHYLSPIRTEAATETQPFMTVVSTLIDLGTQSQMFPTEPKIKGKRKADESNPLLNAAATSTKRAKKDAAKLGASVKRKLNQEEAPNSLLIVRAQDPQPSQSSDAHPQPPSKKFKADTQPPARPKGASQTKTRHRSTDTKLGSDLEVEKDVRAMDDEADKLRRLSRARTTVDASLLPSQANVPFQPETPGPSRKGRALATVTTEQRANAMAAIGNGRNPETPRNGVRRKSSASARGKRVSTSFEATGIITQPHNSVSESSFYKHIDADLPDTERIRQLLIWCSLRTLSTNPSSSWTDLPPLDGEALRLIKLAQEDVVRRLAEKKIDLSSNSSGQPQGDVRENEQNVRNRQWEVSYTGDIQKAQAEEEAWKKVSYDYDGYGKKLQSLLEERTANLEGDSGRLSAKAKGKRRASNLDTEGKVLVLEHELPAEFRPALSLAKSILGLHRPEDGGGGRRGMTRTGMDREKLEGEIRRLLPSLEFTIDQLYSRTSAAKTTTDVAERMMNERFEVVNSNLASRVGPSVEGTQTTRLLSTYVGTHSGFDERDLMRALTRVDEERSPGQVGDAARRAVREVQRAGETGYVGRVTTPRRK